MREIAWGLSGEIRWSQSRKSTGPHQRKSRIEELSERGSHPPELSALGIRDYREVFFKPYRVIYRVQAPSVWVYVVADGRRDMQRLLARRLLGG